MALKLVTPEPVPSQPPVIEEIPAKKDLDTYTTTGVYYQPTDGNARSGTNYPPDVGAGLLEVFNPDGAMTYQRYTRYGNNNRVWTRGLYKTTWSSWKQVSQDGHKHTSADTSDAVQAFELRGKSELGGRLIKADGNGRITVHDDMFAGYGDAVVNKRYVDSRIKLVSSLPSSPEPNVLYLIAE